MSILKRSFVFSILLCGLILLGPASQAWSYSPPLAESSSHYVDKDANGHNDGTSWLDAWKSFGDINWGAISPGDTIYISGGSSSKTYYEILDVGASGTEGNPVVITGGKDSGHAGEVILDGQESLSYGVRVRSRQYVVVRGLNVRNYIDKGQIQLVYSSNVLVEDNDLYVTGHGGVWLQDNHNAIVRGNRITTPTYYRAQTDGIYSQFNHGNTYENNYIVISNYEENGHNDGIQLYKDTDITIRNNYIDLASTKALTQGIFAEDSYGTIETYNNVIYGPNARTCLISLIIINEGNARLLAHHNTLVGGEWGVIWMRNTPNSIVKNNIMVTYRNNGWLLRLDGAISDVRNIDYNLYYAPASGVTSSLDNSVKNWSQWKAYGYEAHGMNVDPLLRDVAHQDFRLKDVSPAIDAGANLPEFSWDYAGQPRPQGAGFDLGAYETSTTAQPTFIDVPFDHTYYAYIEALYQEGYTEGCNADPMMYCPDKVLNRAESAVFVERGIHGAVFNPQDPTEVIFADVALDAWYADWAHGLWDDGFTAGCETDPLSYCPEQEHARAEGTVFYLRVMYGADYEPPPAKGYFKDVDPEKWYAKWVDAAYEAGIAEPCATGPDLLFCPEDPLTRAVAAYMMVQAKGLE